MVYKKGMKEGKLKRVKIFSTNNISPSFEFHVAARAGVQIEAEAKSDSLTVSIFTDRPLNIPERKQITITYSSIRSMLPDSQSALTYRSQPFSECDNQHMR